VKPRLPDLLNLTVQNNYQTLDLDKMMQDEENARLLKFQTEHSQMVASVEAISLNSLSTPKLLTGPWTVQFAIFVLDMNHTLSTLKCAIVFKISVHQVYTVLSDKVSVNLERSMITCYF
jgi:hypothetical protein